ncbi:MerR family transcriptional regulator [Campylobacter mucosalis]|uniref:heat shock protein transcriptional repressor HspR n=1 Tax=Campylobacter mucosalis TaxID=202 RepID=UPI0004D661E3|nr:helix-turn-helix transcriptional regulator [Campylobacter mucosalis]KEA46684.1 MerR family transcriptional regulator [Campylobacter mucosalis]QKF62790.1 heat shock transcriptional regulator, MerR family [Campylobacter mucosalis]
MQNYHEPLFLISVVAKVLNIHPQTLRQYEREGLIEPSRTDGRMRLYSQHDVDKVKMILRLTRDLGVNLAGVDVILQLKDKLDEAQSLIAKLQEQVGKNSNGDIPSKKSLVKRKANFDLIFYEEK